MLTAMAEVASELGAANVTVAHVVARSGVSRRTFYEHFAGRDECVEAAFELAIERIAARVVPAYRQHEKWSERVRASLHALLSFLDEAPYIACLVFVQALSAGPAILERRRHIIAILTDAIDLGREQSSSAGGVLPLTAEGVVGAVFSIVHARLLEPARPPLVELASELMSVIALPYLGPVAARRELERPIPERPPLSGGGLRSLGELDMRLTYRTVRVLLAIGSHPGASNRQVASVADIHDQGQISKLLRRLDDLGLIDNAAPVGVKGEANSWTLTEQGIAVRDAISGEPDRA